jgi:hypothetical protein
MTPREPQQDPQQRPHTDPPAEPPMEGTPKNPVQEEKEEAGLLGTDPSRASRVSAATKPGAADEALQPGNADPGATIGPPATDEGSKQVPMGDPASVDAPKANQPVDPDAADQSKER